MHNGKDNCSLIKEGVSNSALGGSLSYSKQRLEVYKKFQKSVLGQVGAKVCRTLAVQDQIKVYTCCIQSHYRAVFVLL